MDDSEKAKLLVPISDMVDRMMPCGSRVTCNPPPTDTDEDYLVFVDAIYEGARLVKDGFQRLRELEFYLRSNGWEIGGSLPNDLATQVPPETRFCSWTLGELNLIITCSPEFFRRHQAATFLAKKFNLLDKGDRIALFQAILYGNIVEE
jgi:hypothetical protein